MKLVFIHVRITRFLLQYIFYMPVIKSAIKKLRQDKKREKRNDVMREVLKSTVRSAKKTKSGKSIAKAISIVDKAAKSKIIHQNKASRLKSALTKIAKPVSTPNVKKTIGKTILKKSTVKKAISSKKS